jgi:hypothetical protein
VWGVGKERVCGGGSGVVVVGGILVSIPSTTAVLFNGYIKTREGRSPIDY